MDKSHDADKKTDITCHRCSERRDYKSDNTGAFVIIAFILMSAACAMVFHDSITRLMRSTDSLSKEVIYGYSILKESLDEMKVIINTTLKDKVNRQNLDEEKEIMLDLVRNCMNNITRDYDGCSKGDFVKNVPPESCLKPYNTFLWMLGQYKEQFTSYFESDSIRLDLAYEEAKLKLATKFHLTGTRAYFDSHDNPNLYVTTIMT